MKRTEDSIETRLGLARRQGPVKDLDQAILLIRGNQVMLDSELAGFYGVRPIALRQQIKRNPHHFPRDFMFRLSEREARSLVSQHVIPSRRHLGGSLPYVFTEQVRLWQSQPDF